MKAPICPICGEPAIETAATVRFRRGGKVLAVETRQWRCPGECAAPDGDGPYVFADLATMKANQERAQDAWREEFGEEMPPPRHAGRPTDDPRIERLQVRMSQDELLALDATRGDLSRSEFVRRVVVGALIRTVDTGSALRLGRGTRGQRRREHRKVSTSPRCKVPIQVPESWAPGVRHG